MDPRRPFWEGAGAETKRVATKSAVIWQRVVMDIPDAPLTDERGRPVPALARLIVWLALVGAGRNEAMMGLAVRHIGLLALIAGKADGTVVAPDDPVTVEGVSLRPSELRELLAAWKAILKSGAATTLANGDGHLLPEPGRLIGRRIVRNRQGDLFATAPSAEDLIRDFARGRIRRG